jgi:hypothetical protein
MFTQSDNNKKKRGQGTVKVSDLFLKYKKILKAPQGTVITSCVEVLHDMGLPVKSEQCTFQVHSRTLVIKVAGPIKSEIVCRKKELLDEMVRRLGKASAPKEIL